MDLHIKILHTEWSIGWGGQEIRIISEMEKLRELGCECALAAREEAIILQEAQKKGFKTYVMPFLGKIDFKTLRSLRTLLKKEHFHIINTHSGIDTWCGGLSALFTPVKFIRTRHLSNKINTSRLNFINELAHFIFTTGESVKEMMIEENRIHKDKIISVPTGIDMKRFDPKLYNKEECRIKLNLPLNAKIVGNLGVLRHFKRQDIFIQIAKHCPPNVYFAIAGKETQEMRDYLNTIAHEAHVSDRVIFLGHLENPEHFLAAIDIFLMTSDRNEGVPQSLMQALAMELPAIASDIGSIRDLHYCNDEYENFILLRAHPTQEEYAITLKKLLETPHLCVPNREFIAENFSLDVMGDKILQIYKMLLQS